MCAVSLHLLAQPSNLAIPRLERDPFAPRIGRGAVSVGASSESSSHGIWRNTCARVRTGDILFFSHRERSERSSETPASAASGGRAHVKPGGACAASNHRWQPSRGRLTHGASSRKCRTTCAAKQAVSSGFKRQNAEPPTHHSPSMQSCAELGLAQPQAAQGTRPCGNGREGDMLRRRPPDATGGLWLQLAASGF